MFFPMKQADKTEPYVVELVADNPEDIDTIPTDNYAPGSTCIITSNSTVYMLNAQRVWVLLG